MRKIGVIGFGGRLGDLIQNVLLELGMDVKIAAVADTDLTAVRGRLRHPGLTADGIRFYTDAREMLDNEELDGCMIGTRCNTHTSYAVEVLRRNIPLFLGLGLGSVLFFTVCYFKSIEMLPLSIAAILLYTSPIWVTLMSVLFFKERLTLRRVAALVLAFGVCVLVSGLGGGGLTPLGLLIGLCSGIGYGLYSILGSVALRKYEPLTVTTYAFLFSAAGSWFICRPAEMLSIASSLPPLSFALDVLSIAVVTAVAPYLLYTLGLKNTPASKAAIMATVEPLVATVLGIVVFSEPLTPAAAAGIILILAAIVLLNAHRKE